MEVSLQRFCAPTKSRRRTYVKLFSPFFLPQFQKLTHRIVAIRNYPSSSIFATKMDDPRSPAEVGGGDSTSYHRPRRPNPETIAYLRGLPLDVKVSTTEITSFIEACTKNRHGAEFPQSLAATLSAIDEIRNEIASLAGDEHGSQCLEILTHIAAPYSEFASRILLHACKGYLLHLSTHRYGSHVLQTILQLAASSVSETDLALHEEAPQFGLTTDSLPSLSDLILSVVDELSSSASQLAIHTCGSHVLRTLLCVLGGVDLVSSSRSNESNMAETGAILRGKKKDKSKKKKKSETSGTDSPHAGNMHIIYRKNSRVSTRDFASALESLTKALVGSHQNKPGELQTLACHQNAGPLLIILLRVLTYSSESVKKEYDQGQNSDTSFSISDLKLGINRKEPVFDTDSLAHNMVRCILCWNENRKDQEHAGDIIYSLSGEPRGSHMLEVMLRLSPDSVYESIVKYGDFASTDSMQGYVQHEVSNFVIQTLLSTTRNKQQAETMLKTLDKVISSGLVIDSSKKRRGILWRTVEMAAKFRVGQDSLLKSIRLGFGSLNSADDEKIGDDADNEEEDQKKRKKKRKKASAIEIKDCIPKLLDLRKPEHTGGRLVLDVAGARTVYNLLRFAPRLCEDVLSGIIECIPVEDLVLIAKDGLGSRCIFDGILEGPVKTPIFGAATKKLLSKMEGHWASLSTDRVGHHSVKKLFSTLPRIDDKAKLLEELVSAGNRLNGNAMGRSVAEHCDVCEYRADKKSWRKKLSILLAKEVKPVDELFLSKTDDSAMEQKSKRKRKRHKVVESDKIENDVQEKKAKRSPKLLSVDAIMSAMSMPKDKVQESS